MNHVCIIGLLVEISNSYLVIRTEEESIKVFYKDFNVECLEIGTPIKIEGKISNIGFPFDVVLAEKVYTVKKNIN